MKVGVRFSWRACWVGFHYMPFVGWCLINPLPFVTIKVSWVRK